MSTPPVGRPAGAAAGTHSQVHLLAEQIAVKQVIKRGLLRLIQLESAVKGLHALDSSSNKPAMWTEVHCRPTACCHWGSLTQCCCTWLPPSAHNLRCWHNYEHLAGNREASSTDDGGQTTIQPKMAAEILNYAANGFLELILKPA